MADILADYREWRAKQPERISTHSDGCHMWHRDCMIHRLADALAVEQTKRTPAESSTPSEGTRQAGFTLTDAEREAIEKAIGRELDAEWYGGPEPDRVVALRGLLERTEYCDATNRNRRIVRRPSRFCGET